MAFPARTTGGICRIDVMGERIDVTRWGIDFARAPRPEFFYASAHA
jgi:hypothetical protein